MDAHAGGSKHGPASGSSRRFISEIIDLLAASPSPTLIGELALNGNPRWSPEGSLIAIPLSDGIATIRPDGTDFDLIVRERSGRHTLISITVPVWSPNGSHLVYSHLEWNQNNGSVFRDLIRVTASGREATALTSDIGGNPYAIQWRE